MIGLDTNVLIRYLTQDDPVQSPKAARVVEGDLLESGPGFITVVSMVEIAWVLQKIYRLSDVQLAKDIEKMLQVRSLFIQNEREVHKAMLTLKAGRGSFEDALIGELGLWAGCTSTLTFDKSASRLQGFELIA
jgi:predicted nucleic-acid-binding protein